MTIVWGSGNFSDVFNGARNRNTCCTIQIDAHKAFQNIKAPIEKYQRKAPPIEADGWVSRTRKRLVLGLKGCYIVPERMSSRETTVETVQEIPLVETASGSACHDLFAATHDSESDSICRAIWADFRLELVPRISALRAISQPTPLCAELHALRGMSAQFGLFLLEIYLFAWEARTVDPMMEVPRLLPGALAIAGRSLEAIEEAFPHLKSPEI